MTTPAPRFRSGAGRLSLDFIRTLRRRGTPEEAEELHTPEALAAWVRQLGPCRDLPAGHPPTPALLALAQQVREAAASLLHAARSPEGAASCPDASRELLNRTAAGPVPVPVLDASGALHWHAPDPVPATLALLARDALELAASPLAARLRQCSGEECGCLFLDTSRPGTRRWCSMSTCGNQAKKAAFREREQR
ncbi:CGNR zinc finger domain-containing protein [Kitasatospora sp. NPDC006697]|uniref:CGNR zinc finger domain-containing protein n=1 Tax=Kitasatospora sp. NPDC006697 TaxID=3364020 RepID=UPI0036C824DB